MLAGPSRHIQRNSPTWGGSISLPFDMQTIRFFGPRVPVLDGIRDYKAHAKRGGSGTPRRAAGCGGILPAMPDGDHDQERDLWIEKATRRLSECEADIELLTSYDDRGRRRKLGSRAERYRSLLELLAERPTGDGGERPRRLEEDVLSLERELTAVKERILSSAGSILDSRARLREIRSRFRELAHEIMQEREDRGQPRGRVDPLDFSFAPPPPGAPQELRALAALLRELGF